MSDTRIHKVLVAGATGNLGRMVVDELLTQGVQVRALVRAGKAQAFADRDGVEAVVGDLEDSDSLNAAVDGVHSVVSCVQGGPDIIVDGQLRLFERAAEAGVKRFIPSDFSFDLFNLSEGANINSDWRRAFASQAGDKGWDTQIVHVLNGCFLDMGVLFGFLGAFDLHKGTLTLWGDGQVQMDFTTYKDSARFAAIAATAAEVPNKFEVAGDTLSFWELKSTVEAASGRSLEVVNRGTLEDLDALIAETLASDPQNLYAYLPLMYWRAMLNGDGKLTHLVNERFPSVKATTVQEYVRAHRDQFVG